MSDTVVFALEKLYRDVVARFAAEGTDIPNHFGFREAAKQQVGSARITWKPGDATGKAGDLAPPKQPGRNPRSLATLNELFTVTITAANPSASTDELEQYRAVRLVYDAWLRAVMLAARETSGVVSTTWLTEKLERPYGMALEVVVYVESMIPDAPAVAVSPPLSAQISTTVLDRTEPTNTEDAP